MQRVNVLSEHARCGRYGSWNIGTHWWILIAMSQTPFQPATTSGPERAPFRLYVPPTRDERSAWPVILYLHGAGSMGTDNLRQTQSSFARMLIENPARLPALVVFPQCPPDRYWVGHTVRIALDALRTTVDAYRGDERRLYLVGNSLGGYGAWHLLALYPDIFAAVVTVSGGLIPTPSHEAGRKWAPAELLRLVDSPSPHMELARAVGEIPAWLFHGELDPEVPVAESRGIVAALRQLGGHPRYTEYAGGGHEIAQQAWADPDMPKWLLAQKRAMPARWR
jgi:predicted peptidase